MFNTFLDTIDENTEDIYNSQLAKNFIQRILKEWGRDDWEDVKETDLEE